MKQRILIVEDDPSIRLGLTHVLEESGYEVFGCNDGLQAESAVRQHRPDLIILDVMLPSKNGFDICRSLRASGSTASILMLSAKSQEVDKVVGLELGADDYVTKPFSVRELLARIQSLLRRSTAFSAKPKALAFNLAEMDELKFGDVTIDIRALRGMRGKAIFELTARELAVLSLLYQEAGKAVNRETILSQIWGQDYYGTTRTLDQVIVKLRQKIEETPAHPRYLLTVHGVGYRLEI